MIGKGTFEREQHARCCGFNCVRPERYVEAPSPRVHDRDLIRKQQSHSRWTQVEPTARGSGEALVR